MATVKFFFENGLGFHAACAGDPVRNLRYLEEAFGVAIVSRDAWVELSGGEEAVARARAFLEELSRFHQLRGERLDQRDFELLVRSFRDPGRGGDLRELWSERIAVSPRKRDVLPRSRRQLEYVRAMREKDVVFGIGPAGTGKTYLAMAMAVSEFLRGNCTRIVLTRPARESGENLGFLPGNLEDKVMPYLRPLYDALYDMLSMEEANDLITRNIIEVAPLAFMRGRTLNSSFIILDEAQNTTVDQMLRFLTRMGFNSRCVITGDPTQNDLGRGERSGLLRAEQTLQQIPEIAFCRFGTGDVVRHALLEKIITAYTPEAESC